MDNLQHLFAFAAHQWQPWGAGQFRAVAALGGGELDVLHQLRMRVEVQQWRVPTINFAGFIPLSGLGQVPNRPVLGGKRIDQAAHPADRAEHHTFQK